MPSTRRYAWLYVAMLGLVPSCALDAADGDGQSAVTNSACNGSGRYRCFAHVRTDVDPGVGPADAPAGLTPTDLQSAYDIPTSIVGHPTIALIDAYGDTALESDLATYRAKFDLPECSTANGCLKIVNTDGNPSPLPPAPPSDDDWTVETSLDVDMASAACPSCNLVVIQATDDQGNGLELAQATAAGMGAAVISNSWGGPEKQGVSLTGVEPYFDQPVAVFVAAGDDGYDDGGQGPDYPGTSSHTIAVGGTHLEKASNARGWTETAWSSGGSACSLSIPKPSYQIATNCSFKATTDIAAVGDPMTGMASYNSNDGGWTIVGGTSAATPLVAAMFAATGNGGETSGAFIAQNADKLNDVTSGNNGDCGNVLCTAGNGWDGPTGYGTPDAKKLATPSATPDGSGDGQYGDVSGGCAATNGSGFGAIVLAIGLLILAPTRAAAGRRRARV
jgi:subtilase family serine protease